MIPSQLSAHFTLEELSDSDYAMRHGINNSPPSVLTSNLMMLAAGLERVRAVLGVPMYVKSGYRSPALNRAIRGAQDSQHMRGLAADFVAPEYGSPRQICESIAERDDFVRFDQLIQEGGAWVHVSFTDAPRGEILSAIFGRDGVAYYRGLA
jgi:zinc D-Ala-D-Ala carboxypeptidase